MKTFEYRGLDPSGRAVAGLIEALGPKEAREKLAARRILAERLVASGGRKRLAADGRAVVYRELGSLLRAGMTLVRSLEMLIGSPEMAASAQLLAGVRDRVRDGSSLADALAAVCGGLSAFEQAVIRAAERSATVPAMLGHLAGLLEDQERLRHRIRGALIYPSLVVVVGLVVAATMMGLLIPRAQEILAHTRGTLPGITRFMIGAGRVSFRWGIPLAVAAAGAAALWVRRVRADEGARTAWDRRLFGWPLVGQAYTALVNLRFARTLALLLRSGTPLIEAVGMAGRATGSRWVWSLCAEQQETVRHGGSLSAAVRNIPPLSAALPGWIEVGEASGDVAGLLETASRRYEERWDRISSRTLSVLEPALILAVGLFVLLVTLSVLLPVLQMSRGLAGG